MQKEKPNLIRCIKQTGIFLVVFMLLNVLRKLLFNQSDFNDLKESFLAVNHKAYSILLVILILLVGWILVSIIFGSIYYVIKTIYYKKTSNT